MGKERDGGRRIESIRSILRAGAITGGAECEPARASGQRYSGFGEVSIGQ